MMVLMQTDLPLPVWPGDQQMRHFFQIADHGPAGDILAKRDAQCAFRRSISGLVSTSAKRYAGNFPVWHLNSEQVGAGNRNLEAHLAVGSKLQGDGFGNA